MCDGAVIRRPVSKAGLERLERVQLGGARGGGARLSKARSTCWRHRRTAAAGGGAKQPAAPAGLGGRLLPGLLHATLQAGLRAAQEDGWRRHSAGASPARRLARGGWNAAHVLTSGGRNDSGGATHGGVLAAVASAQGVSGEGGNGSGMGVGGPASIGPGFLLVRRAAASIGPGSLLVTRACTRAGVPSGVPLASGVPLPLRTPLASGVRLLSGVQRWLLFGGLAGVWARVSAVGMSAVGVSGVGVRGGGESLDGGWR